VDDNWTGDVGQLRAPRKLKFFDSAETALGPEHVMASGAMPPGFPGIRIDGKLYWDGGCASNTPLDGIYRCGQG